MNYYQMTETQFRTWFANFVTTAVANAATLGLTVPEQDALTGANDQYVSDVSAFIAAHDLAKGSTNTKNAAYSTAFALVQQYSNEWQANPAIGDALKLSLGLQIRDTTPSPRPIFAVADLSGSGNSVGTVKLRWSRNGNLPGCNFFVQGRVDGGAWTIVTATTRSRIALGSQAILPTEYRVVTERRGIFSEPSDSVVVYAEGGAFTMTASPSLHLLEEAA